MTYQGHVENGRIVFDSPVELPEGTRVEITMLPLEAPARDRKPIWEVLQELAASIPEEDLKCLPTDGAINHDHYLYGTEKVEP